MTKSLVFFLILCLALLPGAVFAESEQKAKQGVMLMFQNAGAADIPVNIRVYPGPLPKGSMITDEDGRIFLEDAEKGDLFTYQIASDGYYTYGKVGEITETDFQAGMKKISYTMDKRAGTGYEPVVVNSWTDAVEEKLFELDDLRNVDRSVLDTPAFSGTKKKHQMTSLSEGVDYLRQVCAGSDSANLFYLGGDSACPAVVFSERDLSAAASLEEAAERLSEDGKLNVMYQAQIHGNEPAAGEGALAVCRYLSENSGLLQSMNIVVIPYVNGTGSERFTRNSGRGINLNRDALRLASGTVRDLHRLYSLLQPEVFMDGHEFQGQKHVEKENGTYYLEGLEDIQITCLDNLNCGRGIFEAERNIVKDTVDGLQQQGFRSFFFQSNWDSTTSCNYARLQNSLSFLIESNGIGRGKQHFGRRVLAQYESVLHILRGVEAQASYIQETVRNARAELTARGRTYSTDDRFVLRHAVSEQDAMTAVRPTYDFHGNPVGDPDQTGVFYNRAKGMKSRSRPTAYILPKAATGAKKAKDILTANGAAYFELPAKTRVSVSQYTGSAKAAKISRKKKLTFTRGAYVFPMDQPAANLISASLEPDAADTEENRGSFVQAGILKKGKKGYPIYRYTGHDPRKNLKK